MSLGLSVVELSHPDGKATREMVALYEYTFLELKRNKYRAILV